MLTTNAKKFAKNKKEESYLNGNKKNIEKGTKQKRRPGGTGEGSAGEKTE